MFRTLAPLLLTALALLLPGAAALAQTAPSGARIVSTISWVEEWDPATRSWVRIEEAPASLARASYDSTSTPVTTIGVSRSGNTLVTETIREAEPVRFIAARARPDLQSAGIARFGPFRVLDSRHAALVDATDAASPQAFAAMLAAYPDLAVLEFLDAPGTSHDLANLRLGRAIRAAGLATHVPAGGSARSGAVELFLAGTHRSVDPGALFAVHSWRDALGREPADFAPDAPENRLYLDYYAEMGMTPAQARAFYAMTNSVPHAGARWMEGAEMARWIEPEPESPRLAGTRAIAQDLASPLRAALARSGAVLKVSLERLAASAPEAAPAEPPAPRLAYAFAAAGALDSPASFP
ncbi:hypothetical protein ACLBKU_13260 [Erythrobacter sp. NE805]|uniref:hypothetical protein n=1 Tax=Erythrobacter sp. NE805 TaxID=3389875 RepID=UPI00396B3097